MIVGLKVKAGQLGRRAGRKDPEDEQVPRLLWHLLRIEDRQMTQVSTVRRDQGHSEVALYAKVCQHQIGRELPGDTGTMVAQISTDDILAWRAVQVIFHVRSEPINLPVRERAHSRLQVREFGNQDVTRPDRRGEVLDQRLEKRFSGGLRRPFDNRPQSRDLAVIPRESVFTARLSS